MRIHTYIQIYILYIHSNGGMTISSCKKKMSSIKQFSKGPGLGNIALKVANWSMDMLKASLVRLNIWVDNILRISGTYICTIYHIRMCTYLHIYWDWSPRWCSRWLWYLDLASPQFAADQSNSSKQCPCFPVPGLRGIKRSLVPLSHLARPWATAAGQWHHGSTVIPVLCYLACTLFTLFTHI